MNTQEVAGVVLSQSVRVVKSDDAGVPYEVVEVEADGAGVVTASRVVTTTSDPAEFARIIALEQAGDHAASAE